MGWIANLRRQNAVYWPPADITGQPATDGYGKPVVGVPQSIKCRWEDAVKEIITADGRVIHTKATVFTSIPVVQRGYLMLGVMPDSPVDPSITLGCFEIIGFDGTPAVFSGQYNYVAYL